MRFYCWWWSFLVFSLRTDRHRKGKNSFGYINLNSIKNKISFCSISYVKWVLSLTFCHWHNTNEIRMLNKINKFFIEFVFRWISGYFDWSASERICWWVLKQTSWRVIHWQNNRFVLIDSFLFEFSFLYLFLIYCFFCLFLIKFDVIFDGIWRLECNRTHELQNWAFSLLFDQSIENIFRKTLWWHKEHLN